MRAGFLLAILTFFQACGEGPRVTVCISDPMAGGLQCDPNFGDQEPFFLAYGMAENYACYSPRDHQEALEYYMRRIEACRNGQSVPPGVGPNIDVCVSDPKNDGVQCASNLGVKAPFFLHYGLTENFVCFSPRDNQRGIHYLKRKLEACRQAQAKR